MTEDSNVKRSETSLSLKINITPDDFVEFNNYIYFTKHTSFYWRILVTTIVVFLLILGAIPLFDSEGYFDTFFYTILTISALIVLPFIPTFTKKGIKKNFYRMAMLLEKNGSVLGDKTLHIDSGKFCEASDKGEQITTWSGVLEITRHKQYIYVFIDSLAAHIIPIRHFDNEKHAQSFYQLMTDWQKSAK